MLQTQFKLQGGELAPPDVIVEALTKTYAGAARPVIDALGVVCPAGRITVIVGPSGCGKTTLLRCLCGLETADSGTIRFGGDDVTHVDAQHRGVAMVFQNYALYPAKTVAENIAFPLRMAGVSRIERQMRVEAAARLVKIDGLLDRLPAQLSGGQRQRVGIARAIVRRPRVLLMDEPLSNLDTKLRGEMRTELATLQRQIGATTVYVTHDQTEALSLADHLIVMRNGVIEQQGCPGDVFKRPASAFIADFLGSMNLIDTRRDGTVLRFGTGGEIVPPPDYQLPHEEKLTVGFRPEDILTTRPASHCITLTADVIRTELLGSDSMVHLALSGETLRARMAAGFQPGDRVQLFVAEANIHCFLEDGRRIDSPNPR